MPPKQQPSQLATERFALSSLTPTPLPLGNAAAAILMVDDRYLLQLRDDIPGIWYPGHWGLFGGALEPQEDEISALQRELREEIGLAPESSELRLVTRFEFDLRPIGKGRYFRSYYEMSVPSAVLPRLTLHEGADMRAFSSDEVFSLRLSPYDSFALFLHNQHVHRGGACWDLTPAD